MIHFVPLYPTASQVWLVGAPTVKQKEGQNVTGSFFLDKDLAPTARPAAGPNRGASGNVVQIIQLGALIKVPPEIRGRPATVWEPPGG